MAEGDASVYNHFKEQIMSGGINCDSTFGDTFKICLLDSNYSLDIDCNPIYANVDCYELANSDTGYTAGGITMTGYTITQTDSSDHVKWDATDVTWSALETNTIRHAIIYCDTDTDPVNKPLCVHFEIATNSNGGDYTLQFGTSGILLLS